MVLTDRIGIISIIQRSILINQRQLIEKGSMEYPADFIIRPDVSNVGVSELHRAMHIIDIGEHAANQVINEMRDTIEKGHRKSN